MANANYSSHQSLLLALVSLEAEHAPDAHLGFQCYARADVLWQITSACYRGLRRASSRSSRLRCSPDSPRPPPPQTSLMRERPTRCGHGRVPAADARPSPRNGATRDLLSRSWDALLAATQERRMALNPRARSVPCPARPDLKRASACYWRNGARHRICNRRPLLGLRATSRITAALVANADWAQAVASERARSQLAAYCQILRRHRRRDCATSGYLIHLVARHRRYVALDTVARP